VRRFGIPEWCYRAGLTTEEAVEVIREAKVHEMKKKEVRKVKAAKGEYLVGLTTSEHPEVAVVIIVRLPFKGHVCERKVIPPLETEEDLAALL